MAKEKCFIKRAASVIYRETPITREQYDGFTDWYSKKDTEKAKAFLSWFRSQNLDGTAVFGIKLDLNELFITCY